MMKCNKATVGCYHHFSFGTNCFKDHWGTWIKPVKKKKSVFFPNAFYDGLQGSAIYFNYSLHWELSQLKQDHLYAEPAS